MTKVIATTLALLASAVLVDSIYLDSCSSRHPNIVVAEPPSAVPFNITLEPPTRFEVSHFPTKHLRSPNGVLFGSGQARLTLSPMETEQHDLYIAQVVVPGVFNNSDGDLLLHYKPVSSRGGSDHTAITIALPLVGVSASTPVDTHVERTLQNLLGLTSSSGSDSTSPHIYNPFQFIQNGDTLFSFETQSLLYPCQANTASGRYILHGKQFQVLRSTLDFIEATQRAQQSTDNATWGSSAVVLSATSWVAKVSGYHLARPDAESASALLPAKSTIGTPLVIHHRMQKKANNLALQCVASGLGAGAFALAVYVILLLIQRQQMFSHWYEVWGEGKKRHGRARSLEKPDQWNGSESADEDDEEEEEEEDE